MGGIFLEVLVAEDSKLSLPEGLPAAVIEWLQRTVSALTEAFGPDLDSLVLFGSAAEGRMRASSDVNLLVVVHELRAANLDRVSLALQNARAAVELNAMFIRRSELALAADSFAVKFEDILHRRRVILGADPLAGLSVTHDDLKRQVRQLLLNITLRLRTQYALYRDREEVLVEVIADNAAPLRRCAQAILELRAESCASPKECLERLAAELGGGFEADLRALTVARSELSLPPDEAAGLLMRLASLAEAMQRMIAPLS